MQEIESEWRLSEEVTNEELFDLYMAKKKSGRPKDDYPSKYYLPLPLFIISRALNTNLLKNLRLFSSQF